MLLRLALGNERRRNRRLKVLATGKMTLGEWRWAAVGWQDSMTLGGDGGCGRNAPCICCAWCVDGGGGQSKKQAAAAVGDAGLGWLQAGPQSGKKVKQSLVSGCLARKHGERGQDGRAERLKSRIESNLLLEK